MARCCIRSGCCHLHRVDECAAKRELWKYQLAVAAMNLIYVSQQSFSSVRRVVQSELWKRYSTFSVCLSDKRGIWSYHSAGKMMIPCVDIEVQVADRISLIPMMEEALSKIGKFMRD